MSSTTRAKGEYLRFANEHVDAILSGEKTATIRYGDPDRFRSGKVVEFVDESDDWFADAVITTGKTVLAGDVVGMPMRGQSSYETWGELVDVLESYYEPPTGGFQLSTPLNIWRFAVLEE